MLAFAGQLVGRVEIPPTRQTAFGILGGTILLIGIGLHLIMLPTPPDGNPTPEPPAPIDTPTSVPSEEAMKATNLSEFYMACGIPGWYPNDRYPDYPDRADKLPPIQERGEMYRILRLPLESKTEEYTGSEYQNDNLLAEFKRRQICPNDALQLIQLLDGQ